MKDSHSVIRAAATGAAIAAAGTAIWVASRRRRRQKRRKDKLARYQKINLLPSEVGFVICNSPAASSITFFEGNFKNAELYFSRRTQEIVSANPWLMGFLDYDSDGKLALYVPPEQSKSSSSFVKNPFAVLEDTAGPLSRDYHKMVESLGPALCGTTFETVGALEDDLEDNGSDDTAATATAAAKDSRSKLRHSSLWKVTLIPNVGENSSSDKFALVVSANHSFLDGHGFYRIYNMLSKDEPIVSLSPTRKHELPNKIAAAMGSETSILSASPLGFQLRFVASLLRNSLFPRTKSFGFIISKDWINEQKKQHLNNANGENGGVTFLSTNDVVVSHFCNVLQCELAIMAINFRGRIDGCNDDDVGNYEELLWYTKTDYVKPSLIRKSVSGPPFRRAAKEGGGALSRMPTNWEHLTRGTYAAITNWATFSGHIQAGDTSGIQQKLHIPLFDFPKSTPACTFGSMVIFKPKEGDVGVLVGGKQELIDQIKFSGMVGEELLDIEF